MVNATTEQLSAPLNRSNRYYHDTVTFLVEHTIYKVLREPFVKNSPVFSDMFSVPQSDSKSTEGLLDATPIILEGVLAGDFEAILELISSSSDQSKNDTPSLSLDHWISVLQLSRTWLMESVHTTAYSHILSKLSDESFPRRIQIARDFSFADVFRDGCLELVNRPEPAISYEEAECLGMRKAFGLIKARDERQRQELAAFSTHRGPYIRSFTSSRGNQGSLEQPEESGYQDADDVVESLFGEELGLMRREYARLFEKDDSGM